MSARRLRVHRRDVRVTFQQPATTNRPRRKIPRRTTKRWRKRHLRCRCCTNANWRSRNGRYRSGRRQSKRGCLRGRWYRDARSRGGRRGGCRGRPMPETPRRRVRGRSRGSWTRWRRPRRRCHASPRGGAGRRAFAGCVWLFRLWGFSRGEC
jgi:hypothetical protein